MVKARLHARRSRPDGVVSGGLIQTEARLVTELCGHGALLLAQRIDDLPPRIAKAVTVLPRRQNLFLALGACRQAKTIGHLRSQ
jgi:hypothetical protein